eukprot:COSAG01_NODE_28854_length_651_cov_1.128623_2_plen_83_part_01
MSLLLQELHAVDWPIQQAASDSYDELNVGLDAWSSMPAAVTPSLYVALESSRALRPWVCGACEAFASQQAIYMIHKLVQGGGG